MRIFHKGLIIIAVPLLLEIATTCVMIQQLQTANTDYARVAHARQLLRAGSDLTMECYEAGFSLSQCCLAFEPLVRGQATDPKLSDEKITAIKEKMAPYRERLRAALNEIPKTQLALRRLTAGSKEEALAFEPLDAQVTNTCDQLRGIMQLLDRETTFDNCKAIERNRNALDVCVHSLSQNLQKVAEKARSIDRRSPAVFAERRQSIKQSLHLALFANVITALLLVFYFAGNISRRLDRLKSNALLLAKGQTLLPPLREHDEIGNLDESFHNMAQELQEAARKERAMLENVRDVICSLDSRWQFLDVSAAALQQWGYSCGELLGTSIFDVIFEEDRNKMQAALADQDFAATPALKLETRVKCRGGTLVDTLWSFTSRGAHQESANSGAMYSDGPPTVYGIAYDISERKQIERLKQDFMSMVSHDMRTPLSSIAAVQTALCAGEAGEIAERARTKLADARGNVDRLLSLIDDLLELDKLESGNLIFKTEPSAVKQLFAGSASAVEALAFAQKISINFQESDLLVLADGDKIVQVLVNLLSNAIKFSPAGSTVEMTVRADGDAAIIEVKDQGRGIPASHLSVIFERFKQVERADGTKKKGTGLGLSICKLIVENHGGRLGVESIEGQGSRFWFSLPLAKQVVAPS